MATRLVLDELDFNLAALTPRLILVVVIVFAAAHARALGNAVVNGRAVARLLQVILGGPLVLLGSNGGNVGHDDGNTSDRKLKWTNKGIYESQSVVHTIGVMMPQRGMMLWMMDEATKSSNAFWGGQEFWVKPRRGKEDLWEGREKGKGQCSEAGGKREWRVAESAMGGLKHSTNCRARRGSPGPLMLDFIGGNLR